MAVVQKSEVHSGNLSEFLVAEAPASVFYIPEYITEAEEEELLSHVYNAPKPKWTQLSARRLQNWGGLPHPKGMIREKLPKWLQREADRLNAVGVFDGNEANHVLVNEYKPGQGIMPHVDGPLFHASIATITLGSHTILDFYRQRESDASRMTNMHNADGVTDLSDVTEDRYFASLLLERRSLVVLRHDMYTDYLHGIAERQVDDIHKNICNLPRCTSQRCHGDALPRTTRVSLTVRHVPKVLNVKLNLFKR